MSSKDEPSGAAFGPMMLTDAGGGQPIPASKTLAMRLAEWLRHPLILLLLGSAIIPAVVYSLQKRRDLVEARQREALEIVNKNSIFEGQLYGLFSELGLFHQSNQEKQPSLEELKTLQQDLDKAWIAHYLEFRKTYPDAHMWVDDLFGQGVVLKLFSSGDVNTLLSTVDKEKVPNTVAADLRQLSAVVDKYKGTLSESLWELRKLRERCISKEYEFEKTGKTSQLQTAVTNRLNELRDERTKIIAEMAGMFSR